MYFVSRNGHGRQEVSGKLSDDVFGRSDSVSNRHRRIRMSGTSDVRHGFRSLSKVKWMWIIPIGFLWFKIEGKKLCMGTDESINKWIAIEPRVLKST